MRRRRRRASSHTVPSPPHATTPRPRANASRASVTRSVGVGRQLDLDVEAGVGERVGDAGESGPGRDRGPPPGSPPRSSASGDGCIGRERSGAIRAATTGARRIGRRVATVTSTCTRSPGHVAIVADGNGCTVGEEALFDVVEGALEHRAAVVDRLRSSRPSTGASRSTRCASCSPTRALLLSRRDDLNAPGVRVRVIGRRGGRVPRRLRRALDDTEALTAANHRMTLTLAFNYDGRAELADADGGDRARRSGTAPARSAAIDERRARRPPLRARHARPRPARAHLAASPASPTSCSGSPRTPSSCSPTSPGPTSAAPTSSPPSPSSNAASAASAPSTPPSSNIRHYECADVSLLTDVRNGTANYTGVVNLYRDQGVVLRTIKLGETDRIVTILTQGHGKIRAVAKGVRKPGSRFGARLEPTSHVALQCYRGRELDVVTQVETIDANRALREHYGCLTHAVSMLEATDQVAQEREPNPALYRMLVGALRTLAEHPSPLVSAGVLLEAALARGLPPDARRCAPAAAPTTARSPPSTSRRAACCARRAAASPAGGSSPTPCSGPADPGRRAAHRARGAARAHHRRPRAARAHQPRAPSRAPSAQRRAALTAARPRRAHENAPD